nr:hypothetical protein GCM10020092_007530 [Actinoplanes digitatis]
MWLETTTVMPTSARLRISVRISRMPPGSRPLAELVQDQQRRVLEQGGRHGQALLHAQRVGLDAVLRPVTQPDELEHLGDPGLVDAARLGQQGEGFLRGEVGEELRALHDRADRADHLGQGLRYLAAEDRHPAAVRLDQSEQGTQRSGLAGAVGTEEAVHLPRLDDHVEAVESLPHPLPTAIGLLETLNLQDGAHAEPPRAG